MESREFLLSKMENLEEVLTEIRFFLSMTEDDPIKVSPNKQDLEKVVESLRIENNVLKKDRDQLHVTLAGMKASKDYLLEKSEALEQELVEIRTSSIKNENVTIIHQAGKQHSATSEDSLQEEIMALKSKLEDAIENAIKAELEKQDLKISVHNLQNENKTLKCEKEQIRSSFDCLKSEMTKQLKTRDDLMNKLEEQLDCQRKLHEAELRSLRANNEAICKKLETSKQELDEVRSKCKDIEQHFSAEKVKNLIARVNAFMDNCDVDSAISTFTSYIFNVNLISNFNIVHVFNKIHRIKETLKVLEEQLLNHNYNAITSTYNQLKNMIDYPNLIMKVEKKLLGFYRNNRYYLTAITLCDRLVKIRKSEDPWVHLVHGEFLLQKGNYREAREAFFYSLKFAKEGDPDLEAVYEQARKTLQQEISANVWSIFHTDGSPYPLPQKELYSKYKELMRYYHPDKQHGYVKQYKDLAECMSKELTQSYRFLTT